MILPLLLIVGLLIGSSGESKSADPTAEHLLEVSGVISPSVAYAVQRQNGDFVLAVETASDDGQVSVSAGVSADKTLLLPATKAVVTRKPERSRFEFRIPANQLVENEAGWNKLRLAFSVEWGGGPLGQPRQRERFLHVTPGAAHAGLSSNPADWQAVDVEEFERLTADNALLIGINFTQPIDGKATLVVEDLQGTRIRNLISGKKMDAGQHRIVWDGLDDAGRAMPPGEYRWRAISHPGLEPVHQMDFVNAPGSNHGTLHAATTNGDHVFLATQISEGGHQVVMLESDGTMVRGFNAPHGIGLSRIAIAADDRYIYGFYDGGSWGSKVDRTKSDWKDEYKINLVRFDIESGRVADYPDQNRMPEILKYEVGPGSPGAFPAETTLRGAALFQGRLYVADGFGGQLLVIDPVTGGITENLPLAGVGAIAASQDALFAVLESNDLVRLGKDNPEVIAKLPGKPAALTVAEDGRFFVSDAEAHVVRVLDPKGREVSVIGTPGGLEPGQYSPLRLQNPAGLAVLDALIWITEDERWEPKRFAAYDIQSGKMVQEYFGPTSYGAAGAGFDSLDHTRWIGQGTLWELDFNAKTAKPVSILGIGGHFSQPLRRHTFWHQDDRTFVISSGKATYIQELLKDGTMRPLAAVSSAHQYAYSQRWKPSEEFRKAFERDYSNAKVQRGDERYQPGHGHGMLWVDVNGDGEMQAEEIEFATAAENLGGSGWSHDFHNLALRIPAKVNGQNKLIVLEPNGFHPSGAPKYPALNDAVKAGVTINLPGTNMVESAVDRFDRTILNSSPEMMAFSPDGRRLWTYPNLWTGVHGSQEAPLPSPGELQGALFFTGLGPLDDQSDVMVINGNHGRAFVMTTDGLYLDEMFPDVRLMNNPHASGIGILGGECFGSTFGHSKKDGNYYFQGGGIAYRVYRVDGLRKTKRSEGTLTVTPEQSAAAERAQLRQALEQAVPRAGQIAVRSEPPVIDGKDNDWTGNSVAQWDRDGKFPVTVRSAIDDQYLYLHYTVGDDSPWVNNGDDWQALFKTGDGIDLQIGTDPNANPMRSSAAPGDLRLFIAPQGDENIAILYRHRVPNADSKESVVFQSPWRSEKVDVVKRLESAQIAVERENNRYRVEVAIPLADLGLDQVRGQKLRGDFGVIYGDREGTTNIYRNYWSNQATGLVNDVPGEILLTPAAWGDIQFEGSAP